MPVLGEYRADLWYGTCDNGLKDMACRADRAGTSRRATAGAPPGNPAEGFGGGAAMRPNVPFSFLLVAVVGLSAHPAAAGIFGELRLHDSTDTSVVITHVGQVVAMDLYVSVIGSNADYTDDALWGFKASFQSTNVNCGSVLGDLWGEILWPFTSGGSQDIPNGLAHQPDLDGDGDLDMGGTIGPNPSGWFAARAGRLVWGDGRQPAEFHVANVTFTVTGFLSPEADAVTEVNAFRPDMLIGTDGKQYECVLGALWMEDGLPKASLPDGGPDTGTVTMGDAIALVLDPALQETLPPLPPEPDPPPPEPDPPAPEPDPVPPDLDPAGGTTPDDSGSGGSGGSAAGGGMGDAGSGGVWDGDLADIVAGGPVDPVGTPIFLDPPIGLDAVPPMVHYPEPATLALLAVGGAAILLRRRKR